MHFKDDALSLWAIYIADNVGHMHSYEYLAENSSKAIVMAIDEATKAGIIVESVEATLVETS